MYWMCQIPERKIYYLACPWEDSTSVWIKDRPVMSNKPWFERPADWARYAVPPPQQTLAGSGPFRAPNRFSQNSSQASQQQTIEPLDQIEIVPTSLPKHTGGLHRQHKLLQKQISHQINAAPVILQRQGCWSKKMMLLHSDTDRVFHDTRIPREGDL